jgi:hypothetical protein
MAKLVNRGSQCNINITGKLDYCTGLGSPVIVPTAANQVS